MSQNDNKHITFIVRGLHDMGGIERVTLVVASMMVNVGYKVSILCIQKGVPYFEIPNEVRIYHLDDCQGKSRSARLKNWMSQYQPSLVIVSGTNRPLFILRAIGRCPLIAWEHLNATISAHPLHNLYRHYYAKRAKIVTLSNADAKAWQDKFPSSEVFCIPNPVTLPKTAPSDLMNKRILAVGRLAGQKGFDLLIRAWAMIEKDYPDWTLRIVGSGRRGKQLQKLMEKLKITSRVEMMPATPRIIDEYQNASIYALSSRYEGFGLVLVEAMQFGLPIVSFDCPHGPKEIVSHGETGLLVPNGNIAAFAEALSRMISSSAMRREMSEEALKQVERFGNQVIISKWIDLINSLIP